MQSRTHIVSIEADIFRRPMKRRLVLLAAYIETSRPPPASEFALGRNFCTHHLQIRLRIHADLERSRDTRPHPNRLSRRRSRAFARFSSIRRLCSSVSSMCGAWRVGRAVQCGRVACRRREILVEVCPLLCPRLKPPYCSLLKLWLFFGRSSESIINSLV